MIGALKGRGEEHRKENTLGRHRDTQGEDSHMKREAEISSAATNQGMPGVPEAGKGKQGISPRGFGESVAQLTP